MLSIIESNNDINQIIGEAVDLFFTPVSFDVLTSLSIEYQALEKQIKETHQVITKNEVSGVLNYFLREIKRIEAHTLVLGEFLIWMEHSMNSQQSIGIKL